MVTAGPPETAGTVRSSYTFREFGYAVEYWIMTLAAGPLRIAALPPPVSTGSRPRGAALADPRHR